LDTQIAPSINTGSQADRDGGLLSTPTGAAAYATDIMVGVACLVVVAWITASWTRRPAPDRSRSSQGSAWIVGTILLICGFVLLAQAGMAMKVPWERPILVPLLSALACWAAALAMRPPLTLTQRSEADVEPAASSADRRQLEEALKLSQAEVRRLAEAEARRNAFLAVLGHELRNPLAPIRNALRIMKRHNMDDPSLRWARDVVEHQLHHLGKLVDDLQEITRVVSGKVRLDMGPVDVATIVAFALETSRPAIDVQHHRLSIAVPPDPVWVEADSIRMAQVLSNLLNNAAKYTEPQGQIRLIVTVEAGQAVFRVRDNGIGIAPEMVPRIFDLFAQVDHALDRSQGGLGLGLTLVRSLVEMHGGTVEARSEGPGQGSEFVVRLPMLDRNTPGAQPAPKSADPAPIPAVAALPARTPKLESSSSPRRILVVDDNASAAQSMAMILKLEGYDVRIAYDGGSALEAIRSFRPEAVLMDITLPVIDGHEVARRLRQDPDLASGIDLLIALTGHAGAEARRRSREAGFHHHLIKPVDPDSVLALLGHSSLVPSQG
jgi:signal transduction histidine kinase/ActR/RegA family two-component response regulator